jgi:hypothetical protein
MAGKGSFDEADYPTALNYFKDAYRRDCTKHELLIIIARAHELKGQRPDAIRALETYLERVPNAQDAEVQRRRIANLKAQMAAASPPAAVPTGAPAAAPAPAATSTGQTGPTGPASADTGTPREPARSHTAAPWIVVGAGGAALVAGAVIFVVGAGKVSDAEANCPTHKDCAADDEKTGNSGRTLEAVGIIAGSVGAAAVVGGLLWHFLERPGASKSAASVAPDVRPGYAGLRLGATF